jgi:hypothetical protein
MFTKNTGTPHVNMRKACFQSSSQRVSQNASNERLGVGGASPGL